MILEKITTKQFNKLIEKGFPITEDTTVLECIKLCRSLEEFNDYRPRFVNVHSSAYYVAEVMEYRSGYIRWYSYGTNSWEHAESLALDYMLGIYEIPA